MRVVFDTNIIISVLVFHSGQLAWLRQVWRNHQVIPLINYPCAEELLRVLTYPKFKLSQEDIEIVLGGYLPFAETIKSGQKSKNNLPKCKDIHDQKFLELADTGKADVLVTGDKALLELQGQTPFDILTASSFRKRL